jgi:prepilin-type N-terminal cleavage/methylation domain-containing protein
MRKREPRDEGFTIIEVLAATVILSVVSLAMMAFFIQAMSYNKGNQNKTVMINLARNALFYMEKQNFKTIQDYFITDSITLTPTNNPAISPKNCSTSNICSPNALQTLFVNQIPLLWDVLNPTVNEIDYQISISYQYEITEDLKGDLVKQGVEKYLLPIRVEVTVKDNNLNNGRNKPVIVEGYIANETIR